MSNTSYPKGMEKLLSGKIDVTSVTLAAALLPSTYTYSTSHEFLSQVGTVVGTAQTLAGKSVTGGVFDADDADFGVIAAGPTAGSAVIYKDTGSAASSPLLLHITDLVGLPLTANVGAVEAGDTLELECYRLPRRPMANDTDKPEIHEAHHLHLVQWALHRAFSIPDADAHDPQRSKQALDEFERYFGLRPDADLRRSTRHDEVQTNAFMV